ncbi:MAG: acyltransferase [Rhodanobacteraceae bacterium]|nr:acyltransferase [Rhodanobacteraceae bacterium]
MQEPGAVEEISKFDYIDALRGFAIIGVIMVHIGQWIPPDSFLIGAIAQAGKFGVQLFFVVSAFTLMMSLESRRNISKKWMLEFFVRRFFRIAPAFYLAILFYIYVWGTGPSYWAPSGIDTWQVLLTIAFLHGWHVESINAVVPGGWSIAAEVMFYITLPWLYLMLRTIHRTAFALLVSIVLAALLRIVLKRALHECYLEPNSYLLSAFLEFFFLTQLPVFLIGILTFQLAVKCPGTQSSPAMTMGYSLLVCASALTAQTTGNLLPQSLLFSVGFCLLVLSLNQNPIRLMVNPMSTFLGKISFSLYLVHFFVIGLFREAEGLEEMRGNLGFLMSFLIVLAASSAFAFVLYRFVEVPGIALGKRAIDYIRG